MAARKKFPFKTSTTLEVVSPTAVVAKNPLDNTTDGATSEARAYDPAKDETLSGAEAIGQTVLSVNNAGVFVEDDIVELIQDDGTTHQSTVASVDTVAGTVTIDDVTTVAAAIGNRFRVRIGAVIAMSEYGTPVLGKRDWGFRGTLASTHAVQVLDREFNLEFLFVGNVAGGLDWLGVECGVIKPVAECSC
jgi:hypothetical protein